LNNNKLINEKLICAFRWPVLPSAALKFMANSFPVLYVFTPTVL